MHKKRLLDKTIRLCAVSILVLSVLAGCKTSLVPIDNNVPDKTLLEAKIADTVNTPDSGEEVIVSEEVEETTERRQLVTPRVTEVTDDYVWSSILALQDKVEREKLEKSEADEARAFLDGLFGEQGEGEKGNSDGTETSEALVEETTAEPEEAKPLWGVLDSVEQEKIDNITIMGDLTPVTVTSGENSGETSSGAVSVADSEKISDRILIYRDGEESEKGSAPSWLYSDEEKAQKAQKDTTVNVSIIQEQEKAKTQKSTVTPEDILALSQSYQAGRVTDTKTSSKASLGIYDKAMELLQKNYQYVFLAFAIVLIALLMKAGVKHLKSEKRTHKGDIKGKTFTPEDAMIHTLDPSTKKSFSEIFTEPAVESEKAEKVENESTADRLRRYIFQEENGDTFADAGEDELTLDDAVTLSGILLDSAFA